jgi:heme-degrading monooxygenase HmoA
MTTTVYTSGTWTPTPGGEEAFIDAWRAFATWASGMPGAGRLNLVRDLREPQRFVSFGSWDGVDDVRAWKSSPEFRERMAQVLQHVDEFKPAELTLVASAEHGAANHEEEEAMSVHYKKDGIATFDATPARLFAYMSAGGHPHAAFKSHRLSGVDDGVVTVTAEVYNPDGSTFETTIRHRLDPPNGIETTMSGGPFDGARFVHTYTPLGERTKVDLEGDFPALPGMNEADELAMIDGFFTTVFDEDTVTLRTWSPEQ